MKVLPLLAVLTVLLLLASGCTAPASPATGEPGMAELKAGNYPAALAAYQKTLAENPDNPETLFMIGMIYYKIGQYNESLQANDQALALFEKNASWKAYKKFPGSNYGAMEAGRGMALAKLGRCSEAVTSYNGALESLNCYQNILRQHPVDPACPELWKQKAGCLDSLGRTEEAALARGMLADPGDAMAHYDKGSSLAFDGKCEAALPELDLSIAAYPYYYDTWISKTNCHSRLALLKKDPGELDKALDSISRAIAIRPTAAVAYGYRGGVLYMMKKPADALAAFDAGLAIDPGYADLYIAKARIAVDTKGMAEGVRVLDEAGAAIPDNATIPYNAGRLYADSGNYAKALEYYNRSVTIDPKYKDAWWDTMWAYKNLKKYPEALAAADRVLEIVPKWKQPWLIKGEIYEEMGKMTEANACYAKYEAMP
jgi:tetratricopeptide (TPR) repeat protein